MYFLPLIIYLLFTLKGSAGALLQIDMFIDLLCPDSKLAFSTLLETAEYYAEDQLRLIVHNFPLPYHRNGFLASQGLT